MIYGLAASALPVWLLLAPRDYLSTFLKLGTVAALAVAVFIIHPTLQMPALTRFIDGSGLVFAGPVFPFVCITIACGAVSGFHSLIASGTTPKMLEREARIRAIGYGAMVTEMMVALMALIAASRMEPGQYFAINAKGTPARSGREGFRGRLSGDGAEMTKLASDLGENDDVRPRGRRADFRGRHGAYVLAPHEQSDRARALVSLRDHVRGALHSHHDRCRHARRAFSPAGFAWANFGDRSATRNRWARIFSRACSWSARGAGFFTRA